ncbi:DUF4232 domain-containing protein [Streptomyces sp. NPDC088707]|uniref:DUF4232 domain-containing protein n=1 Tax=Streptomyces sp. NPDC088707 TaxID=3365871 RepID=UPI003811D8D2
MSGRTTRTRLLAATTLAVAALSLTACGSGAAKDEGAAITSALPTATATQPAETPATPPTGGTTTKPRGGSSGGTADSTSGATAGSTGGSENSGSTGGSKNSGTTTGTASGGKSGGTTSAGTSGSGGSGGATASASGGDGSNGPSRNKQCGAGNTRTTATPVARPLNHMLLTVTNTGSGLCDLLGYPVARFGAAQSVPPVMEETHPQAVVTLAPGESGYAGVILSAADGSGQHGYTTTSLTVGFTDGTTARPKLAGKGVYVDSSLRVTYWQGSMDDALN